MLSRPRALALVLSLGVSQIAAFASSFYIMGVLGDPIAAGAGVAPRTLFALFSGAMLVSAALSPVSGRLMERFGAKRVFLTCLVLLSASLACLSLASNLPMLALAMGLMGVGMTAGLYAGPNALAVEVFGDAARRPITLISLVGGFGSTSAWVLTPRIEMLIGWRGACLVWAAVLLLVVAPLVTALAPHARHRPPSPKQRLKVRWDRAMLQLAILFCGTWFIAAGVAAHLPRLLTALGLAPAKAATIAGCLGLAAVSARAVELTVLRRAHPLLTARIASLGALGGALLIAGFGVAAAPFLVLLQGVANGLLSVANGTLPLALWGREGYAVRAALLNTPAKFAQTAAPLVLALTLDHSAALTLALTAGIGVVMSLSTLGLRPRAVEAAAIA